MGRKIVFCGGGNMAEGIIRNIIKKGVAGPEDIIVSEVNPERCSYLKKNYGVEALIGAEEEIKQADMAVIAVLPKIVPQAAEPLRDLLRKDAVVLSIAAGVRIETLEKLLGTERKIIRVMPNTLGQSGNGHSAVCVNANVTEEEKTFALEFLGALGQTLLLPEDMFNAFTAYSCTGPLWLYQLADALIDAGVYAGFSRKDARKMAVKNMLGVAMILDETGEEPRARVNEMCSPGGITIEGYKSLVDQGFSSVVMTSVDKAVKKANSI